MADDLAELEPWLQAYLARLSPGQRTRTMRAIGKQIRRSNGQRIRANVDPDGGAMPARLPRPNGRLRKKRGRMFAKLGLLRNLRVKPTPDSVTVDFQNRVYKMAKIHHFGETDTVDRKKQNSPRVRYAERRLLGFSPEDRADIIDEALKMLKD